MEIQEENPRKKLRLTVEIEEVNEGYVSWEIFFSQYGVYTGCIENYCKKKKDEMDRFIFKFNSAVKKMDEYECNITDDLIKTLKGYLPLKLKLTLPLKECLSDFSFLYRYFFKFGIEMKDIKEFCELKQIKWKVFISNLRKLDNYKYKYSARKSITIWVEPIILKYYLLSQHIPPLECIEKLQNCIDDYIEKCKACERKCIVVCNRLQDPVIEHRVQPETKDDPLLTENASEKECQSFVAKFDDITFKFDPYSSIMHDYEECFTYNQNIEYLNDDLFSKQQTEGEAHFAEFNQLEKNSTEQESQSQICPHIGNEKSNSMEQEIQSQKIQSRNSEDEEIRYKQAVISQKIRNEASDSFGLEPGDTLFPSAEELQNSNSSTTLVIQKKNKPIFSRKSKHSPEECTLRDPNDTSLSHDPDDSGSIISNSVFPDFELDVEEWLYDASFLCGNDSDMCDLNAEAEFNPGENVPDNPSLYCGAASSNVGTSDLNVEDGLKFPDPCDNVPDNTSLYCEAASSNVGTSDLNVEDGLKSPDQQQQYDNVPEDLSCNFYLEDLDIVKWLNKVD